jgi:hypothetical protein
VKSRSARTRKTKSSRLEILFGVIGDCLTVKANFDGPPAPPTTADFSPGLLKQYLQARDAQSLFAVRTFKKEENEEKGRK